MKMCCCGLILLCAISSFVWGMEIEQIHAEAKNETVQRQLCGVFVGDRVDGVFQLMYEIQGFNDGELRIYWLGSEKTESDQLLCRTWLPRSTVGSNVVVSLARYYKRVGPGANDVVLVPNAFEVFDVDRVKTIWYIRDGAIEQFGVDGALIKVHPRLYA